MIPLQPAARRDGPPQPPQAEGSALPPRVLLVDDDAALRAALQFALELEDLSVETFASAEDLLERADVAGVGCLVLDQKLPGMTGLDLLAELRRGEAGLPAILITTHPAAELRRKARAADVEIVEKPLLCDALLRSVRTLVAAPQ